MRKTHTLSEQSMRADETENPTDELEHICANCHSVHPSEPVYSEFAVCLHDPEFEPYLDAILDKQDFSRCQHLIARKRFAWESKACEHFDPIDPDSEIECSSEVARSLENPAKDGDLSSHAIENVLLEDLIQRIDWKSQPVDRYVEQLNSAESSSQRDKAIDSLGALVLQGNKAAFDVLCSTLRNLSPGDTLSQSQFKSRLLRNLNLTRDYRRDLAHLLVQDLFNTPSNNQTRGWYTDVFKFFVGSAWEFAEEALSPMLDSPRFSYRIKRRVREVILRCEER